jgi:hypothetical protein
MDPASPNGNAIALGDHGESSHDGDHFVTVIGAHITNGIAVILVAVYDTLDTAADADQTTVGILPLSSLHGTTSL